MAELPDGGAQKFRSTSHPMNHPGQPTVGWQRSLRDLNSLPNRGLMEDGDTDE